MGYDVSEETFASLNAFWQDSSLNLNWSSVFVLPVWLKAWWQTFGEASGLYLRSVRQGQELIGLAPLRLKDGAAYLLGSADVCDYLDFITLPGREADFFGALLDNLEQDGVKRLNLESLRPEAAALRYLADIARERGYKVSCRKETVAMEMELPPTWEEYLMALSRKQRHEVKRKLRRLEQSGRVAYHFSGTSEPAADLTDTFLRLFSLSWEEKASFMTPRMTSFFRLATRLMAGTGLLRLGTLELDDVPVAIIMGFDYQDSLYLYNSGYDPKYDSLSVGLLSKVLGIKTSIEQGKRKWDFMKGDETYKHHLGGKEIPIYHCQITKF